MKLHRTAAVLMMLAAGCLCAGCAAEKQVNAAVLSFDSFDGGGPEYSISIEDPDILSCEVSREYREKNHEELDGAGYSVNFVFTGLKEGETCFTISSRSPMEPGCDRLYEAEIDRKLQVTLTELSVTTYDESAMTAPTADLAVNIGSRTFYTRLEDNDAAQAFAEKISSEPLEAELHDYGGFEKTGPLPWALPADDEKMTAVPGDLVLYEGDKISLFYGENTWEYTRLASIGNVTAEELREALGEGDVTVSFWLEWSE